MPAGATELPHGCGSTVQAFSSDVQLLASAVWTVPGFRRRGPTGLRTSRGGSVSAGLHLVDDQLASDHVGNINRAVDKEVVVAEFRPGTARTLTVVKNFGEFSVGSDMVGAISCLMHH